MHALTQGSLIGHGRLQVATEKPVVGFISLQGQGNRGVDHSSLGKSMVLSATRKHCLNSQNACWLADTFILDNSCHVFPSVGGHKQLLLSFSFPCKGRGIGASITLV